TAERLHGCVVNDAYGYSQRPRKIKMDPVLTQVLRVSKNSSVAYRRRKTNRRNVEFPAPYGPLKFGEKLVCGHSWTGCKFAFHALRHEQFHEAAADIDDENSSLHERASARGTRNLSAAPEQSPHTGLRFGLRSCGARPALYDFKRYESEQQLPGRFQIEPQIFCNLLHGPATIELRAELGLIRSQLQLLDAIEAFSRVSRDRCRIETYWLLRVLYETQCFQRPVVHIRVPSHVAKSA